MSLSKCACGTMVNTDDDVWVERRKDDWVPMCSPCKEAWESETDDDEYNSPIHIPYSNIRSR